jgi:hypothetical protein
MKKFSAKNLENLRKKEFIGMESLTHLNLSNCNLNTINTGI